MRSQKALVMEAGGMGVVSLSAFLKVYDSLAKTVYRVGQILGVVFKWKVPY